MTTQAITRRSLRLGIGARVAAAASVSAGLVHLAVVPEHRVEWIWFGMFFTALAAFEIVWAAIAWVDATSTVLAVGLVVNAGVLLLWAFSRTTGLPFGPEAWHPEEVGFLDGFCCLAEIVTVLGVAGALSRQRHRH